MVIKWNEAEEKTLTAFYGGKDALRARMHVDENNKILRGKLIPGASIGEHRHENTSEIIFVLSGQGRMLCDGKEELLFAGDCHYCPKGSTHAFENVGAEDLLFYAVVPTHA